MSEIDELAKMYEQKTEKKRVEYFYVLLFLFAIIILFFNFFYPTFIYSKVMVIGSSMEDTIEGATEADAKKLVNLKDFVGCSRTKKIERGDIVVFTPPGGSDFYIKRVVAIEGDTVSFQIEGDFCYLIVTRDDDIIIDGYTHEETYIKEPILKNYRGITVKVEEGEFYALGDNRNNSSDSRKYGAFKISTIYGVARDIYREKWSLKIGSLKLYTQYDNKGKIINPLKGV